ncbi:hypothetical protein GJ496_011992 [Pomphorhynchus laevis]|nr:hypothetical protein GJ496_011992 [Pomphorhynchus laevis]
MQSRVSIVNDIFNNIKFWTPNLFYISRGSPGSEFVDKVAEQFELASSENENSKYALAEVTVISQLILQRPLKEHSTFKSLRDEESIKVKEKLSTLQHKLSLEARVALKFASEKGASSWLRMPYLDDKESRMICREFRDAISVRYRCDISAI